MIFPAEAGSEKKIAFAVHHELFGAIELERSGLVLW